MSKLNKIMWAVKHDATYLSSFFSNKDKKLWIFGAWNGASFSDNSKYLYLFIRKYHPEINAVWISKNEDLVKKMQTEGYNAYYYQSKEGIALSKRASAVFTTSGLADVAEWAHGNALHINLWHGTPLKKIGFDNENWEKNVFKTSLGKRIKSYLFPYLHRNDKNDLFMVTSEAVKKTYMSAFRADEGHIYITGQPRNDVFASTISNPVIDKILTEHPNAKIVCYLPTHRNFGTKNNNPLTGDVLRQTDKFLREHNIVLIFKPHVHEMKYFLKSGDTYTNIIFGITEEYSDVYEFLPVCDLLISDYSSVYVDYICTGKPIVLYAYDLEDYVKTDAGLYRPFEEAAPGPICKEWSQVLDILASDIYEQSPTEKYKKVQKYYNTYLDGRNCERVYEIVAKKLGIGG